MNHSAELGVRSRKQEQECGGYGVCTKRLPLERLENKVGAMPEKDCAAESGVLREESQSSMRYSERGDLIRR